MHGVSGRWRARPVRRQRVVPPVTTHRVWLVRGVCTSLACSPEGFSPAILLVVWSRCPSHLRRCGHWQTDGQSPLHYALKYKFSSIVDLLISFGADEYLVNRFGLTPYEGLSPSDLDD
jgi:hypothetical protein